MSKFKSIMSTVTSTISKGVEKYAQVTDAAEKAIMKKCGSDRMMDDVVDEAIDKVVEKTVSATQTVIDKSKPLVSKSKDVAGGMGRTVKEKTKETKNVVVVRTGSIWQRLTSLHHGYRIDVDKVMDNVRSMDGTVVAGEPSNSQK